MRSRTNGRATMSVGSAFSPIKESPKAEKLAAAEVWEVRPSGMLVQMRNPGDDAMAAPVPTIRVKVKYGAACHEIYISSQASFWELKKALSARTGLHPLDMKLMYKDKERESTAFLDAAGVKDKSKVVLMEDPTAKAKRLLEMRKTNNMEKAAKSISTISLEVDRLASKVIALEAILNKGGRVVGNDVINLTECLMNELVKLDAIVADGDVKLQRKIQIKRVQKHVETLDSIKIKNATPRANAELSKEQRRSPLQKASQAHPVQLPIQPQPKHQQPLLHSIQPQYQQQMQQARDLQQLQNLFEQPHQQQPPAALQQLHTRPQFQQNGLPQPTQPALTNWEPFDLLTPSTSTPTSSTTTASSTASSTPHARFEWELF
ncbi:BAG family molecular chaperone regulator 1-like [Canna indica]|uniref:BAG family molecular chaperone regulator 1-like n=1 Tax=Canna indica TaxID=4628 RepID=A0AAQ3Q6G4_9LILI|nr:BAG family molecular chaperone regulator 1-like [Canna indica]